MAKVYSIINKCEEGVSVQSTEWVCVGQLASLFQNQGHGLHALAAVESFRGLMRIIARNEHKTVDGAVAAASLCYRLAGLYREQTLLRQSDELCSFALSLTGIAPGALPAAPTLYVVPPKNRLA